MPDIEIDEELHSIVIAGETYGVDLIAVSDEINRIIARHRDAKGYGHLEDFAAYLAKEWGMPKLRASQANRLWEAVVLEVNRQKKEFVDAVKSLSSTDSSPAEAPDEEG